MNDTCSGERYGYAITSEGEDTPNLVLGMVGHSRDVLELGCAMGTMSQVLVEQQDCRVTGIEIDPELAQQARRWCAQVLELDLDSADWPQALNGANFDAIIAADVLEHLRDPGTVLRQLLPLLRPEGQLVVSIPNVAHAGIMAELALGRFSLRDKGLLDRTHLRFFTRRDFDELLLNQGWLGVEWRQKRLAPDRCEMADRWALLPDAARRALIDLPDADVYQHIVRCIPCREADRFAELSRQQGAHRDALVALQQSFDDCDLQREQYAVAFHEARDALAAAQADQAALRQHTDVLEQAQRQLEQHLHEAEAHGNGYAEAFHEARDQLQHVQQERDKYVHAFHQAREQLHELERHWLLRTYQRLRGVFSVGKRGN